MSAIIIPAYNEATIIARAINSLLSQMKDDDELIVVANGCSDNTAEIARAFEPRVKVIDTPIGSKIHALNLGDDVAITYPRIYFDADVEMAAGSLDAIKTALTNGKLLAASPVPQVDFSRSSWFVKAYYDIWHSMPFCKSGLIGGCVYAISEEGRKRFDKFPDIIADDGYARALFKECERGVAEGAVSKLKAPINAEFLMKIKTRSRMGQMQLAQLYPELVKNEDKQRSSGVLGALKNPLKWPHVMVYLYVTVMSRILAKKKLAKLADYKWEKDTSSR